MRIKKLNYSNIFIFCRIEALIQEKDDLEADFIDFKRQVQNTSKGAAAKEIRILKGKYVCVLQENMLDHMAYQQDSIFTWKEKTPFLNM